MWNWAKRKTSGNDLLFRQICSMITNQLEQESGKMTFICYPKCSTCQKAEKWLDENRIV